MKQIFFLILVITFSQVGFSNTTENTNIVMDEFVSFFERPSVTTDECLVRFYYYASKLSPPNKSVLGRVLGVPTLSPRTEISNAVASLSKEERRRLVSKLSQQTSRSCRKQKSTLLTILHSFDISDPEGGHSTTHIK